MDSDSETDESVAIAKTYDKVKTSLHKIGFVEGLSSGKDASFQSGFDHGYKEGFSNGYQLGKLNGILSVLQARSRDDETLLKVVGDVSMEPNTKHGLCLLCNPQTMDLHFQNSHSIDDSTSSLLDTNIKLQLETTECIVFAHIAKVQKAYALYNIPVLSSITNVNLINKK